MQLEIVDKEFKHKFKTNGKLYNSILLKELCSVVELPEGHYTHSALYQYYKKYPHVFLDRNIARQMLETKLKKGVFFIVDYEEFYNGGYPASNIIDNEDSLNDDPAINEVINLNWIRYETSIKNDYWKIKENIDRCNILDQFSFFENRPPANIRESFLSSGREISNANGDSKKMDYHFFNIQGVINYYYALINQFYPDFKLIKEASDKKVKRFGKKLGSKYYLGLYFDIGYIEAELKNTYLELPKMKVELFEIGLQSSPKEEVYLRSQVMYPIVRISYSYFMGNPNSFRIGTSADHELDLKRELYYYFDVYSFFLKKYLMVIEDNLRNILELN